MRSLEQVVRKINFHIEKKRPKTINENWIKLNSPASYRFIIENSIDWDIVTINLNKSFQGMWNKGSKRKCLEQEFYKDEEELNQILNAHKDKLYTFISRKNKEDEFACDRVSILLVRLAQRGNVLATQRLKQLIPFLINQWIDGYKLSRWRGYDDLIDRCIDDCIRRYRYSGSFIGYLNKTMECSGRALKSVEAFSLDQKSKITDKAKINNTSKDYKTGEVKIF